MNAWQQSSWEPSTEWAAPNAAVPPTEEVAEVPRAAAPLLWIDALKTVSILGVIGIHVTADSAGLPYASHPASDRVVACVAHALSTAFNYPVFLVVSFFLLALGLEKSSHRRSYSEVLRGRLLRLLPLFLLWSLIFLGVRSVKAIAFGYHIHYLQELASPVSWLRYLFLGGAQYHLHFLPILIGLTLFYPLYRLAGRWPVFGAALLVTVTIWPRLDSLVYASLGSSDALPFALTATKLAGFTGYGFLGFALYRLYQRGMSSAVRVLAIAATAAVAAGSTVVLVDHGLATALAGRWLERDGLTHAAYYFLPAAVVTLFLFFQRLDWPTGVTRLGSLSFGVYLFHPIVLDALEIAERGWGASPKVTVAFNFVVVSAVSFLVVNLASRVRILRSAFGVPPVAGP